MVYLIYTKISTADFFVNLNCGYADQYCSSGKVKAICIYWDQLINLKRRKDRQYCSNGKVKTICMYWDQLINLKRKKTVQLSVCNYLLVCINVFE